MIQCPCTLPACKTHSTGFHANSEIENITFLYPVSRLVSELEHRMDQDVTMKRTGEREVEGHTNNSVEDQKGSSSSKSLYSVYKKNKNKKGSITVRTEEGTTQRNKR